MANHLLVYRDGPLRFCSEFKATEVEDLHKTCVDASEHELRMLLSVAQVFGGLVPG